MTTPATAMRRRSTCLGPIAVLIVLLASPGAVPAQTPAGGLKVDRSSATGLATFVRAGDGGTIPVTPRSATGQARPIDFFHQHGALFGITDPDHQLALRQELRDRSGRRHVMFEQLHRGVPVFAGDVRVHLDADDRIYAVNGDFFPVPSLWKVEDDATAVWMDELYRSRLEGSSTAAAVRAASRAVLDRSRSGGRDPHPFYWGAFVAAGDWR